MTREEFKARWESNDSGGGITFDDCAKCAEEWRIMSRPRTKPMDIVVKAVIKAAGIEE